jgi:hypothetical protein
MRENMRPELVPPRIVSARAGSAPAHYRPWVEVAALVRMTIAAWGSSDETWVHWAVPVVEDSPDPDGGVPFDPGRRAAFPGDPAPELRAGEAAIDEGSAAGLCQSLRDRWRPQVHYHPVLRLSSRLNEPREEFQRRCASVFSRAARQRGGAASDREAGARLAAAFESRTLTGDELEVLWWRVGVGWYPAGVEPTATPVNPLMQDNPGADA